ncbi:unnamed protein product [Rotaria sp. Silwood2]|nr:unnamed protein product [Rotaria sp. Silwood2]CAF4187150.1 unnamed protein product [Rotaria sp. Silwood2]
MITCITDLPVELLQEIFDYLSAFDICHTFHNLNDYLNNAIQIYSKFKLDFQSIQKSHFDLICQYVQPLCIKALRLSDHRSETVDQSELFLSRINANQMKNLQALSLAQIEDIPFTTSSDKYSFFSWEPNYVLNYATVRHLIFQRDIDWDRLVDYYSPNLSELTLQSLNKSKQCFPLYSIRKHKINEVEDIDEICSIFPSIEHLKIPVYDQNEIAYIINRLEYLCSAVFLYNGEKHISIKWICKKTNLIEDNFTYRLDRQLCVLYMWINNQSKVI